MATHSIALENSMDGGAWRAGWATVHGSPKSGMTEQPLTHVACSCSAFLGQLSSVPLHLSLSWDLEVLAEESAGDPVLTVQPDHSWGGGHCCTALYLALWDVLTPFLEVGK